MRFLFPSAEAKRQANAERLRRFRAAKPEWNREKNAKWNAENKEKRAAHKTVEAAIRTGLLQRSPCERCGATKLVHAHHDDYSRPLDVMWLCPLHHRERHRELKALAETPSVGGGVPTQHVTSLNLPAATEPQRPALFRGVM